MSTPAAPTAGQSFVVGFNPVPMANQVAVLGSRLRRLLAWEVVAAALVVGLLWWQHERLSGWGVAACVLVAALALGTAAARLLRARGHLARIGAGPALEAEPSGLHLHALDGRSVDLAWDAVGAVRTAGLKVGTGPELVVESAGERVWSMPLTFLDALPGTIDAGLRARSAGRVGLDLSGLDTVF